jgi:dienelactone hydrolase
LEQLAAIELEHAGTLLVGQMARPAGNGPFPVVLVMHSALGLDAHMREVAQRLASLGYLAVATDMYGGGVQITDPWAKDQPNQIVGRDPVLLRSRILAWYDTVANLPEVVTDRVAAIGYCFGGSCVLELARSGVPARAVVSYHGVLTSTKPMQSGVYAGEVHAYCGAHDPYAPLGHIEGLRAELAAAGTKHTITIFGDAAHGFTDRDYDPKGREGIAYNELADRLSWAGTLELLEAVLRD